MSQYKRRKTLARTGADSLFQSTGYENGEPSDFRLNTPNDTEGTPSLYSPARHGWRRRRFSHYIAAGGTGQTRRTWRDDVQDSRRRIFLVVVGGMVLVWLLFYWLP